MVEVPEAPPYPLYAPHTPGVGGIRSKLPKNLTALQDHLCAKFHPNLSSGLDFHREHTNKHTDIGPLCIGKFVKKLTYFLLGEFSLL